MEYAVINLGSKQYRVSKGDVIEVNRIGEKENTKLDIDNVLLYVAGDQIKIGKPNVQGVRVKAKILENKKGKKIRVAKFQSKVRYRKVIGFRPQLTMLQIEEIESTKAGSK
ncbi:MAG: 50S ribosomal protein L21 [Candidatus Pacearchaeota archaeon]